MAEYSDPEETKPRTQQDIITECREHLKNQISDESQLRAAMQDDMRFATLDQWPEEIRNEREDDTQEGGPRPCLTVDKISQYLMQVVNDARQGKPGINVRPVDDTADVETAKILKGIVRNIEDQSSADIAYSTGIDSAAKIGLGYWRVTTEYTDWDSDEQEIFIRPIANTFSVYMGHHIYPDGSDAKRAWVIEEVPVEKFKQDYPKKKWGSDDFSGIGDQMSFWRSEATITVVEYFYFDRIREKLLVLGDGTTITEEDYKVWPEETAGPKPQIMKERWTMREQLKWCKMTGVEVLEERDLPGKYIPIVEVVGRESTVNGRRVLWGLVRPAKDSLRMYNYFASAITERMGLAPLSPYVAAVGQIEGREKEWGEANRKKRGVLQYNPIDVNGNAVPPPKRTDPTLMETALTHQLQIIEHDVQTSLGMYKAAVGETESQQSGRAILALQKESDTATYHFGANQGVSIRHTGRIIVDLIPHYYDTKRVVRILGDDGTTQSVQLDPSQPESHRQIQGPQGIQSIYNPGVGKYDIAITPGINYATKRMEDQAVFVEMAKGATDPASAAVLHYLIMRNADNPGSEEAAKLLKSLLPPPALRALESKQPIPAEAQAVMAQMHQQMQMAAEKMQELQQENVALKAKQQEGMAKVQVDAQTKAAELQAQGQAQQAELQLQAQKQAGELQLAREKAAAEIEIKRAVAEAEHNIRIAELQIETQANEQKMAVEQEHKKRSLDFDMAIKADERKQEREAEDATEAESLAPQLVETLKAITDTQKQIVAQLAKPKTITAKSSSGATMSATIN